MMVPWSTAISFPRVMRQSNWAWSSNPIVPSSLLPCNSVNAPEAKSTAYKSGCPLKLFTSSGSGRPSRIFSFESVLRPCGPMGVRNHWIKTSSLAAIWSAPSAEHGNVIDCFSLLLTKNRPGAPQFICPNDAKYILY